MFNVIEYNPRTNEEIYVHQKIGTSQEAKDLRDRKIKENQFNGLEEYIVYVRDDKGNVWH